MKKNEPMQSLLKSVLSCTKKSIMIFTSLLYVSTSLVQAQDNQEGGTGNSAQINFEPFIYTSILNGRPYLQITIKAVGKINSNLNTVTYHDQKNQMKAAMLTIIARLAKKKFRIGQPLDPDLISIYLQAAVDKTVKRKNAVKIFVIQAQQKPLQ